MSVPQLEQLMYESVNNDRAANGATQLKRDATLDKLARDLAQDMSTHGFFGHQSSDGLGTHERAKRFGITCGVYENLGSQSGPDPASSMVEELERSFMSEPPEQRNHRYVLLYPQHCCVGIGIAKSKDEVIIVQEFTDSEPTTTDVGPR